ncbi:MAG: hypothetical protein CMH52_01045 [Myxococcales bacterium]|nr:hypothetical protein [Myxococcales bacterium]
MLDEHLQRRAFIAIAVGGRVSDVLSRTQRALFSAARSEDRTVQSIPRRLITIPLFDLGYPYVEALEAAQLAIDRVITKMTPFSIDIDGLDAWPDLTAPQLLSATIKGGSEQICQLRSDLLGPLMEFGFPVRGGHFVPTIPLVRVQGSGPEIKLPNAPSISTFEVKAVGAFVEQERFEKFSIRNLWYRTIGGSDSNLEHVSVISDIDALRQQLEEKLSQRTTNFRSRRVRTRVDDLTTDVDADDNDDPSTATENTESP